VLDETGKIMSFQKFQDTYNITTTTTRTNTLLSSDTIAYFKICNPTQINKNLTTLYKVHN
jgi:hypothetical protein